MSNSSEIKKVEVMVVLPFLLRRHGPAVNGDERVVRLRRAVHYLDRTDEGQFVWKFGTFPTDAGVMLRHLKWGVIECRPVGDGICQACVSTLLDDPGIVNAALHETIWYYDYGVCIVDCRISLELTSEAVLVDLYEVISTWSSVYRKQLESSDQLEAIASRLEEAFTADGDASEVAFRTFRRSVAAPRSPSRFTGVFGLGLLVEVPEEGDRFATAMNRLSRVAERWAGAPFESSHVADAGFATGYNGFVAMASTLNSVGRRIRFLWRTMVVNWTTLDLGTSELHDEVQELLGAAKGDRLRSHLERVRALEFLLSKIEYEVVPESVCGDAFDLEVYGGSWNAWLGDRLVARISRDSQRVRAAMERSLADDARNVEWTLTVAAIVLTVPALAGAMAEVMSAFRPQDVSISEVLLWVLPLPIAAGFVVYRILRRS